MIATPDRDLTGAGHKTDRDLTGAGHKTLYVSEYTVTIMFGKRKRYCATCNRVHFAPTGKKCPAGKNLEEIDEAEFLEEDRQSSGSGVEDFMPRGNTPKGYRKGKSHSKQSVSKTSIQLKVPPRVPPQPSHIEEEAEEEDGEDYDSDRVEKEFRHFVKTIKHVNKKLEVTDNKLANMESLLLQVLEQGGNTVVHRTESPGKNGKRGGEVGGRRKSYKGLTPAEKRSVSPHPPTPLHNLAKSKSQLRRERRRRSKEKGTPRAPPGDNSSKSSIEDSEGYVDTDEENPPRRPTRRVGREERRREERRRDGRQERRTYLDSDSSSEEDTSHRLHGRRHHHSHRRPSRRSQSSSSSSSSSSSRERHSRRRHSRRRHSRKRHQSLYFLVRADVIIILMPIFLDFSMGKVQAHEHIPGVFFYPVGLYSTKGIHPKKRWRMDTYKGILRQFKEENKTISYLKFDIETMEWTVLDNMLADGLLRNVVQLSFELHVDILKNVPRYFTLIKRLHDLGFRRWFYHHRLNGSAFQCDQSYINMNYVK